MNLILRFGEAPLSRLGRGVGGEDLKIGVVTVTWLPIDKKSSFLYNGGMTIQTMLRLERCAGLIGAALLITLAQIAFVLYWSMAGQPLAEKYVSLNQHDSQWYAHIAENGYALTTFPLESEANVMAHIGFFPGYPTVVAALKRITGMTTAHALLITAQIFTVGVWLYVLLFLRRYRVPWKIQTATIITLLAFPSAFFLVCGYSESLFTFALLGYLYWMTDDHPHAWILASAHGFVMSATRIVGIPLLVIPLVHHWLKTRSVPTDLRPYLTAMITGLGAGAFFLYCQATFGDWNIYSRAQSIGWGVVPQTRAILDASIFAITMPDISWDGFVDPDDVSRLSVPVIFAATLIICAAEFVALYKSKREAFRVDHLTLCLAIGILFIITVTGLYAVGMRSVIRYMLPPFVLLSIIAASMASHTRIAGTWSARILWAVLSALIALSFFIEAGYIDLYSHQIWVA